MDLTITLPSPGGFTVDDAPLLAPSTPVDACTRRKLSLALAAIIGGATPEAVAGFERDGYPQAVQSQLELPYEAQELSDHVDALLAVAEAMSPGLPS